MPKKDLRKAARRLETSQRRQAAISAQVRLNNLRQQELLKDEERLQEEYRKEVEKWWQIWEEATGHKRPAGRPNVDSPKSAGP